MFDVIRRLSVVLNQIKGFEVGYTSSNNKLMIVNIDNVNYKLTLEKISEGKLTLDTVEHLNNKR